MKQKGIAMLLVILTILSMLDGIPMNGGMQVKAAQTTSETTAETTTQTSAVPKVKLGKDAYFIQVNKKTNCVTVFKKDKNGEYKEPVKAFICSTGNDTPKGTFHTMNIFRWQPLMGGVYGQYCTQIIGNILFHSVYYGAKDPSTLSNSAYNVLGKTASHGCIRLTVKDAKWIYDNCSLGTTVKIMEGSEKKDVLGKPKSYKVNNSWDPTDPSKKNPWKNCFLTTTILNKKVEVGTKIDWSKIFTVTDAADNVVSSKYYKVKGKVNTKKAGSYKISVITTDKKKVKITNKVTIKVYNTAPPSLTGVDNVTIERGAAFDMLKGVKAKTYEGKKISKKKIIVTGTVANSTCGKYTLVYQVTDTKSKKIVEKKREITVVDTTLPVIEGVTNKSLTMATTSLDTERQATILADVKTTLKVVDNGEILTDKATITVTANADGTYLVTVSYTDVAGNKASTSAIYQIALN